MSQTKYIIHLTMLTLWLFACVGQPVMTIVDDGNPLVTNNLNEEEQKEQQSKKSNEEEKFISKSLIDFNFDSRLKKTSIIYIYSMDYSDYIRKIVLPPPEIKHV